MTSNQTRIAHCTAARAFAERVDEFTRTLNERRQHTRDQRQPFSSGTRLSHPEDDSLVRIEDPYEELVAANEELHAQMAALEEATAQIDAERGRYTELFEHQPVACLLADRAGVIQSANRAALALLDAELSRLRGRSVASLVEPNDAPRVREALQAPECMPEGELLVHVRRPRGASFSGVFTATRLEHGRRTLVTLRELGETQVIGGDNAALARALRDKEDVLARERALRAQLEKTDQAKDRFIAILSHDLRGPINSVIGWTQLLRREQLPREGRERALETIERSSRAQLALVEELLDLSRITADKMVLEIVPLDLPLTVSRLVDSFLPVARDARVTLESDVTTSALTVFADRKRLTQIVSNLVTNAIKFTPPGGRVLVRVRAEGALALVEVEDTGQGMKPEALNDLFECYRQGCGPATARNGLGLGLYIVKQLVQLHGGTVEAHSAGEGHGSTLTVRLPLRESTPSLASETMLSDESTTDLDGVRVLVVEDEPDARELLTTVLANKGANVSSASNAKQAVAMFESCVPDVVVSDIDMPGEDGCALIRRLRKQSADVPAIAVSGFAGRKDAERALDAGFDLHVSKPIEARELVNRIRSLSARRRH